MWLWLWVQTFPHEEAGSNTSIVTLRVVGGDEMGRLKSERLKYGREFQGTRTWQRLRWQKPAAYKKQTSPLVREGAAQKQASNCQRVINIRSWAPDGARHQDLLSDWPSVAKWLWLQFSSGFSRMEAGSNASIVTPQEATKKGKSWIWDSKIWSRVPRDSDPRMNALASASSNRKWQTHPLVTEEFI
jgi:hypothetical protein